MTNFTDLDLTHKKILLINLFVQNKLINGLSEITEVSKESLVFHARTGIHQQVDELTPKEIDQWIIKVEEMLEKGFM